MMKKILIGAAVSLGFAGALGFIVYSQVKNKSDWQYDFKLPNGTEVDIVGEPEFGGTYVFKKDSVTREEVEARMAELLVEGTTKWKELTGKDCNLADWKVTIEEQPLEAINGETIYKETKKLLLFKVYEKRIILRAKPFGDWRHEIGHACIFETMPDLRFSLKPSTVDKHHCWVWKNGYDTFAPQHQKYCESLGLWE